MNAPVYRTIKKAVYTPSAKRTDSDTQHLGDTVYVTFEECDHVKHGNPTMTYSPGTQVPCGKCAAEVRS